MVQIANKTMRWQDAKVEAKKLADEVSAPYSRGTVQMELLEYSSEDAYHRDHSQSAWSMKFYNMVQHALRRELRRKGYKVSSLLIDR